MELRMVTRLPLVTGPCSKQLGTRMRACLPTLELAKASATKTQSMNAPRPHVDVATGKHFEQSRSVQR